MARSLPATITLAFTDGDPVTAIHHVKVEGEKTEYDLVLHPTVQEIVFGEYRIKPGSYSVSDPNSGAVVIGPADSKEECLAKLDALVMAKRGMHRLWVNLTAFHYRFRQQTGGIVPRKVELQ